MLVLVQCLPAQEDCNRPSHGIRGGASFGTAAASVGDLDGDGVAEFAIGEPGGEGQDGRVHVVSGRTGLRLHSLTDASEYFGGTLALLDRATAGDPPVPVSLLAVGAPCHNAARGRVILYTLTAAGAQELATIDGSEAGELLGTSLARLRGPQPVLIVGAPGSNAGGPRRGSVLLVDRSGTVRSTMMGERDFEGHGWSVAGGADTDGDGEDDVIAGSQDLRPAGDRRGRLTVRRRDGGLLLQLDGTADEYLGGAVACAGDLDGDGFDDFLAGARASLPRSVCPPVQPGSNRAGRVYVLRGGAQPVGAGGTRGAILRVLSDGEPGALFGSSLALLDDLDGDALPEIAVGAPVGAFRSGPQRGRVEVISGGSGAPLWTLGGARSNERFGHELAALDDLDGDGAGELLVSLRRQDGAVWVYSPGDLDQDGVRDACEPCAAPLDLVLGVETMLTLTRLERRRCFRFEAPPGAALRLRLVTDSPRDVAELQVGWGSVVGFRLPGATAAGAGAADPGLVIPFVPEATGFASVRAADIDGATTEARLVAEVIPLPSLLQASPSHSAVGSKVAMAIRGLGIPPGVDLLLRRTDRMAQLPALDVQRLSPGRVDAVFDLGAAAPGSYDLLALDKGIEIASLPGALAVTAGTVGAAYRVSLTGPRRYRNNTLSRLTLRVENLGDTPLPPPLVLVSGPPGILLAAARDPEAAAATSLVLVRSERTPDGSLPAGSEASVPLWFRRLTPVEECPPNEGDCTFSCEARLFEPRPSAPLDWGALPTPAGMRPEDWQAALPGLSLAGDTWTDYYRALAAGATVRSQRGQGAASALPVFQMGVRRALELPVAAVTGVVRGLRGEDAMVVARIGEQSMAFAAVNGDGYFVVDWLENGISYTLEVVDPETHLARVSGSVEVTLPAEGDLHGVELSPGAASSARVVEPACPPCDAAVLPLEPLVPPAASFTRRAGFTTTVISAFDPNEKDGSGTQGGDVEIDPTEAIEYRIYFENTATEGGAAAEYVALTDALPAELDWTTVQLLDVAVDTRPEAIQLSLQDAAQGGSPDLLDGSQLPEDPGALLEPGDALSASARWRGEVQVRHGEARSYPVDLLIQAGVELAAEADIDGAEEHVVVWRLDATRRPRPAPDYGFLPYGCPQEEGDPDVEGGTSCGGHVSFTVSPLPGLPDGTVVTNDAEIIFDQNEPELTDPSSTVTVRSQAPGVPAFPNPTSSPPDPLALAAAELRLTWEAAYATAFDVYLWDASEGETRPPSAERARVWEERLLTAHYPPGEATLLLDVGKSWRWQVTARNDTGGATDGPVWRFTTGGASFRRGDIDQSGDLTITDAVRGLDFLFLGGSVPACLDAVDADDSGALDITDPILVLTYLFLGGAEIPPPGPDACGADATADGAGDLGCASNASCDG